MTDIHIAFGRLPTNQIFHTDSTEWVKCPGMMRSEGIIFNAFINVEDDVLAGKSVGLQVRLFDSDDLVKIESEREPFAPEITNRSLNVNDN